MNELHRLLIAQTARRRIIEHARYIAEASQSLTIAEKWLQRVFEAADTLMYSPRRCALAPEDDFRGYEIRRLLVGDYLLLFTIVEDDRAIVVIGLRHGSRLPRADELPNAVPNDLK